MENNNDKILIVSIDDNEQNLLLIEIFTEQYAEKYLNNNFLEIKSFSKPKEGLDFLKNNEVDLLYVDFNMPELDGLELIKSYRSVNKNTPIIMITAQGDDRALYQKAFEDGANDFLTKPVTPLEFNLRTKSLLELSVSRKELQDLNKNLQKKVEEKTKDIKEREVETLDILGKVSEYKDTETAAHVIRVGQYSQLLASKYLTKIVSKLTNKYSKEKIELLEIDIENYAEVILHAAPLHDIGKIGIPDRVLLKDDRLNDEEFNNMKEHPKHGYKMLKKLEKDAVIDEVNDVKLNSAYLEMGALISLSHHERYNGRGYPFGKRGKDIPLSGRIVALADVFDALMSPRPYKKAWTLEMTLDLIVDEVGEHFDPHLVEVFMENIDEIISIYRSKNKDIDESLLEYKKEAYLEKLQYSMEVYLNNLNEEISLDSELNNLR